MIRANRGVSSCAPWVTETVAGFQRCEGFTFSKIIAGVRGCAGKSCDRNLSVAWASTIDSTTVKRLAQPDFPRFATKVLSLKAGSETVPCFKRTHDQRQNVL